jgi:hypothetical protein
MEDFALSLMMVAAFALIVGAIVRGRREGFGRNVWLMFAAAAVILANVAIWSIPVNGDEAPASRASSGLG